jgi:hypothetical protein
VTSHETVTRLLVCDCCEQPVPDEGYTIQHIAVDRNTDCEVWLMCTACSSRLTVVHGGSA